MITSTVGRTKMCVWWLCPLEVWKMVDDYPTTNLLGCRTWVRGFVWFFLSSRDFHLICLPLSCSSGGFYYWDFFTSRTCLPWLQLNLFPIPFSPPLFFPLFPHTFSPFLPPYFSYTLKSSKCMYKLWVSSLYLLVQLPYKISDAVYRYRVVTIMFPGLYFKGTPF